MSFLGEFGSILVSKRLFAVCTTVVQLGILRLILHLYVINTEVSDPGVFAP